MTRHEDAKQISLQSLVLREVVTTRGKHLGRIYDFVAERRGDDLCVTQLVVGPAAMVTRFGWKRQGNARKVPWESITALQPQVRVQDESAGT
jgi:sporulation protein YlmC with PRC-barrel domain